MFLHPATLCRKYATIAAAGLLAPRGGLLLRPARYITCTRVILVDRLLISAQEDIALACNTSTVFIKFMSYLYSTTKYLISKLIIYNNTCFQTV